MPSSSALDSAPSFILTKNGLVSVLVIRQALVDCARAKVGASSVRSAAPPNSAAVRGVLNVMVVLPLNA